MGAVRTLVVITMPLGIAGAIAAQVNGLVTNQSGQPFTPYTSQFDPYRNEAYNRLNVVPGIHAPPPPGLAYNPANLRFPHLARSATVDATSCEAMGTAAPTSHCSVPFRFTRACACNFVWKHRVHSTK